MSLTFGWIHLGRSLKVCVEASRITAYSWQTDKCSAADAEALIRDYAAANNLEIVCGFPDPRLDFISQPHADDPLDDETERATP